MTDKIKPAIQVKNLHKSFDLPHERVTSFKHLFTGMLGSFKAKEHENQQVLKGINFEVPEGEFFGIVGRNGSGKSTLLKLLAGIYTPSKGSVTTVGRIVPFIELGVGFNGELSGRDNVYLNGALLGFSRRQVDKKFNDIVGFAELEKYIDKKLKNYSSGMQVRLAFSIATRLAVSDILLIDEVLAVGDADFQRKCFDYFQNLRKEKKTVILVTHDMNAVREYCDGAILVEEGKVVAAGSPEKVATAYTRLFQEKERASILGEAQPKRWGNYKLKFKKVELDKHSLTKKDDDLVITAEAVASETVSGAIFGISIMNGAGQRLFGSNTNLQGQKPLDIKKGQSKTIQWSIPNIFNEGIYYVCPAAVLSNGEICDNWDEALTFEVSDEFSTGFPVNPKLKLEIKQ